MARWRLVDSSALPEQVVDAVVMIAFRSAGQRCSALRLLVVHTAIADGVIAMLHGAAKELVTGNPAELTTDVGPVIDQEAFENIQKHIQRLKLEAKTLIEPVDSAGAAPNSVATMIPNLIAPHAFEVKSIASVKAEIFGPVLQVVRWGTGDTSNPEGQPRSSPGRRRPCRQHLRQPQHDWSGGGRRSKR